jgi:hypothetical protein
MHYVVSAATDPLLDQKGKSKAKDSKSFVLPLARRCVVGARIRRGLSTTLREV